MNNLRGLSRDLAMRTTEFLNEQLPETRARCQIIRSWLRETPHLICRLDDQFIVTFLRRCLFDFEETKRRIDAFYTCKTFYSDIFHEWAVTQSVLDTISAGMLMVLPEHLPMLGPRLLIIELGTYDPAKHSFHEIFKVLFMMLELIAFEDDHAVICGLHIILDLSLITDKHMANFDLVTFKKMYNYLTECLPLFMRLHVMNVTKQLKPHYDHYRDMLPAEPPIPICYYRDVSDIYVNVPKRYLPPQYGGRNGHRAEMVQEWKVKFRNHEQYFRHDAYYKSDENLRVGNIHTLQVDFVHEEKTLKKYGEK